jgi:hypothetical protein
MLMITKCNCQFITMLEHIKQLFYGMEVQVLALAYICQTVYFHPAQKSSGIWEQSPCLAHVTSFSGQYRCHLQLIQHPIHFSAVKQLL